MSDQKPTSLTKSKKRIADHGEVFTPSWLVESMIDLVKGETERIDSRFLEPACGDGNFLVQVLKRKLDAANSKYGKSEFELKHYSLFGLMCIYGVELLPDNIADCRKNLLHVFSKSLGVESSDELFRAAAYVLSQNLIHGDAMKMLSNNGQAITFAEWGYLGKGKYQRRDFRYDSLTLSSTFSAEGDLFSNIGKHEIFMPAKTYAPISISELASLESR